MVLRSELLETRANTRPYRAGKTALTHWNRVFRRNRVTDVTCVAAISRERSYKLRRGKSSWNGVSRSRSREPVNKNRWFIEAGHGRSNNQRDLWRVPLQLRRCILENCACGSGRFRCALFLRSTTFSSRCCFLISSQRERD